MTDAEPTGLARLHMSDGRTLVISMADFVGKLSTSDATCCCVLVRLDATGDVVSVNSSQIAWAERWDG